MTDDAKKDEIAELRREIAALKPTPSSDLDAKKWADEMHQLRERRASSHLPFSRSDLDAMEAAAPTHVVRAIVGRDSHAPMSPSSAGASGQLTRTSSNPGIQGSNTTGWLRETPLSPPPGINYVDALLEVDSAKARGEAMIKEARLKAAKSE